METKQKSNKVKKTKISYFRILVYLIVLATLVRIAYSVFIKHANTEIVKYGNIQITENTTGFVVKNETIVRSPIAGQLKFLIEEGTKVQKGINVATIVRDGTKQDITEKIKKLDDEIAQASNNAQNNNLFEGDIKKLDAQISEKLKQVSNISNNSEIDNVIKAKSEINELINKRLVISGQGGAAGSSIQSKVREKENFIQYMNTSKVDIPTSMPGILSFKIDGNEQKLSVQNLKSLSQKDLVKIPTDNLLDPPASIDVGQPLFKIINNFEWYVVCTIKTNKIDPLKENDNIKISINNGNEIPAKVYSILNDGTEYAVVTLQLNTGLENYYNSRKVDVKIIKRNYEGIKVPASSIINRNGKYGVMIINKGITKYKEVTIEGTDGKYTIVQVSDQLTNNNGLSQNNEIIINPSIVSEGMIIR